MGSMSRFPVVFFKPIIYGPDCTLPDRLNLPLPFVERFGVFLPRTVHVKTMDGEEFRITFSQLDGSFSGMQRILMKLSAKELQFLILKYLGGQKFDVYVLDTHKVMHALPGMHLPFKCMFFKVIYTVSSCWSPLKLCPQFLSEYGSTVPRRINFHMSNGSVVDGSYDNKEGTLFGLQEFFRIHNMSRFDSMLITYNGNNVFIVRGFGRDCVEKRAITHTIGYFEIEVKASHLLEYDFGVTIPVKYHGVLEDFGQRESLDIRHGDSRWRVLLKKRSKRAELHSGWNVLSKDLELKVGDICFFRRAGLNTKFFLDVYKSCL